MRIIYGYSNCTDKTYQRIVSERNAVTMQPDQKYHGLLIKGFSANGAQLRCYSGLPVNRAVTARRWVSEPDEQEDNAHFHYISTINFPGIRQLMIFCGAFFGILKEKKDDGTYAVCDMLNSAVALAFLFACRLRRIRCAAIVTDLPDMFDNGRIRKKVGNYLLRRFDGYIFLTEHMNTAVNSGKPYIVLEGHVDKDVPENESPMFYELNEGKKVIVYAGNIHWKYGIRDLAEGFILADIPDAELRVYGKGDYEQKLTELAEKRPGIRYMGTRPNSEIVREEQRASLLVNPRPTEPEYTKYSFPSKNMEYMASGTPLLTTKLPGMPDEYKPYVYLIEDESPEGIAKALKYVFSLTPKERKEKGAAAREFVLNNKTNVIQARKIMDFLTTL